jgi:hypothetical protein
MDIIFYRDYSNILSLLMIVVLTAVPFFFGGTCIGYIISTSGSAVNRIYFADLIGAATGCLLAIVLINYCGGIGTCFVIAAMAMIVAALSSARRRLRYLGGAMVTLVLAGVIARTECLPLYVPSDKQMFRMEHMVERIKWHVITRLDVTRSIEGYFGFGGSLSNMYKENGGKPQTVRFIYQDGSNLTGIVQPTPTPRETPSLGYYMQGAPYQLKSYRRSITV